MARVNIKSTASVLKLDAFSGLNEAPDGDTGLKVGEAAVLRNFKITNESNLQQRAGQAFALETDAPIRGIWRGWLGTAEHLICAWGGKLYSVWAEDSSGEKSFSYKTGTVANEWKCEEIGSLDDKPTSFFQFQDKLYILNGTEYLSWDGVDNIQTVEGYRPLVANAAPPSGGGTLQEEVNKLNGLRRMRFSSDGSSAVYQLLETEVDIISRVLVNSNIVSPADYTTDLEAGTVTFISKSEYTCTGNEGGDYYITDPLGQTLLFTMPETAEGDILTLDYTTGKLLLNGEDTETEILTGTANLETELEAEYIGTVPALGTDNVEIWWRKGNGDRETITAMRYAEIFNGYSDNRVFLYGDGGNQAVYSGLDNDGIPTAEYFPDLNVMKVDATDTPITAMVRHFDRLLIFKPDCAYVAEYTTVTVDDSSIAGFYLAPISRDFGCTVYGGAVLVSNYARTINGKAVYDWKMSSTTVRDERITKRVSTRIEKSMQRLTEYDNMFAFDDEQEHEYYVFAGGEVLVHNYEVDAWYLYTNMPASCAAKADDGILLGTENGLVLFGGSIHSDFGEKIDGYWESGSLDFDVDWRRKYSSYIWVSLKPESGGRIWVSAMSNRKSDYTDKLIVANLSTFEHADFSHFSFNVNRQPQLKRARMKVKKFAYYKLQLFSDTASSTATVLGVDIQVRYAGTVK